MKYAMLLKVRQFLKALWPIGPAPADPDELNWPPHEPLVNGKLVTIEVIHVNGQKAPGRALEKAIEGFSKYVAGEVRTVEARPVTVETEKHGMLNESQLDAIVANRRFRGPSDISILQLPGLSYFESRGMCMHQPDGSHVVVIQANWINRRTRRADAKWSIMKQAMALLSALLPRERWWHLVIEHELLHALGVPCGRSHAWRSRNCTQPECILYPHVDFRSVLRAILRSCTPRDLCPVCQGELRRVQQAAAGRFIDPEAPYDHMERRNELVRLNPARARAFRYRASVHEQLKNYNKAAADLSKAIELDRGNAVEYMYRAQAHWKRGNFHKAINDYTRAIELGPENKTVMCYRNRGVTYARIGEPKRAISDWERCLELEPDDTRALQNLAWVLASCPDDNVRDGTRAVKLARRACELTNWKDTETLETLAAAYAEVGEFDQAIEYQSKAISLADEKDIKDYRQRLKLYRSGKPYRNS